MATNKTITATYKVPPVKASSVTKVANSSEKKLNVNLSGYGEEWIPEGTLFKYIGEKPARAVDSLLIAYSKGFIDSGQLTDALRFVANKGEHEALIVAESLSKALSTTLSSETSTVSDVASKAPAKLVTELLNAVEMLLFVTSKGISDNSVVTEQLAGSVSKVLADTGVSTDSVGLATAKQAANETSSTSDVALRNVGKALSELGTVSEIFKLSVGITAQDSATYSDVSFRSLAKLFPETLAVSEVLSTIVDYQRQLLEDKYAEEYFSQDYVRAGLSVTDTVAAALSKAPFIENSSVVDSFAVTLTLLANDNVTTADAMTNLLTFGRALQDSITMSDDFLGAANTDDDQTAAVQKVLLDAPIVLEALAASLATAKSEIAYGNDSVSLSPTKAITDNSVLSDNLVNDTTKGAVDNTNLSEVISFLLTLARAFEDTSVLSDVASFGVLTSASDITYRSDTRLLSVSVEVIPELYFASDYVSGSYAVSELHVSDSQELSSSKSLNELSTTSEGYLIAIGKEQVETLAATDPVDLKITTPKSDQLVSNDTMVKDYALVECSSLYFLGDYATPGYIAADVQLNDLILTESTIIRSTTESNTLTDTVNLHTGRSITRFAVVMDRKVLNPTKGIVENCTITESYVRSIGVIKDDTANMAESFLANNQNYMASSYTAPGYVGSNTIGN
jgi:hypothetical protein